MCKFCDCTKEVKQRGGVEIRYESEARVNHASCMSHPETYAEKEKELEKDDMDNWYDYTGNKSWVEGFFIADGDMLMCVLEGGYSATLMKIRFCPVCNRELSHIDRKFIKDEAQGT